MELYPWQWLQSSRNDQLLQAGRPTKAQGKSNENRDEGWGN